MLLHSVSNLEFFHFFLGTLSGEDRIRTCGPVLPGRFISNEVLSTTQPPLQMVALTGLNPRGGVQAAASN